MLFGKPKVKPYLLHSESLLLFKLNMTPTLTMFNTPFQLIDSLFTAPLGSQVYVVSDSKYQEYRNKQVAEEIAVLERRAESYESTAASIRKTISELQTSVTPTLDKSNSSTV